MTSCFAGTVPFGTATELWRRYAPFIHAQKGWIATFRRRSTMKKFMLALMLTLAAASSVAVTSASAAGIIASVADTCGGCAGEHDVDMSY